MNKIIGIPQNENDILMQKFNNKLPELNQEYKNIRKV
jgi:hypothetical protein